MKNSLRGGWQKPPNAARLHQFNGYCEIFTLVKLSHAQYFSHTATKP